MMLETLLKQILIGASVVHFGSQWISSIIDQLKWRLGFEHFMGKSPFLTIFLLDVQVLFVGTHIKAADTRVVTDTQTISITVYTYSWHSFFLYLIRYGFYLKNISFCSFYLRNRLFNLLYAFFSVLVRLRPTIHCILCTL